MNPAKSHGSTFVVGELKKTFDTFKNVFGKSPPKIYLLEFPAAFIAYF